MVSVQIAFGKHLCIMLFHPQLGLLIKLTAIYLLVVEVG